MSPPVDDFGLTNLITQVVLPKLDRIDNKLEAKADTAHVAELSSRVDDIIAHGSRDAREARQDASAALAGLEKLKTWKNVAGGALLAVSALAGSNALHTWGFI